MAIGDEFGLALAAVSADEVAPELLPNRLAAACRAVLPVDGAGICLFDSMGIRIPVGASDEVAATAERLQFTAGQGPCLDAHTGGRSLVATESLIAAQWPLYYHPLVGRTPFRGVVAVPFIGTLAGFGTVDSYVERSVDVAAVNMVDAQEVVVQVVDRLARYSAFGVVAAGPAWLDGPAARSRSAVFVALGMLNVSLDVSTEDALSLLRGYAYAGDRSVDDVADDLVHRRIAAEDLNPVNDR